MGTEECRLQIVGFLHDELLTHIEPVDGHRKGKAQQQRQQAQQGPFDRGHVSMGVGQRFWNEFRLEVDAVARAKAAGRLQRLLVWNINEEDRLRELTAVDVDGILTDDPETLRAIVSESPGREERASSLSSSPARRA